MALRVPLSRDTTRGFPEDIPSADTVDLRAGASVAGDIAFSSGEPTGLPATPSGATAAASKAYVDAVAAGLNPRPHVRVATENEVDGWTAAGAGIGATLTSPTNATSNNDIDGVTLSLNDRVLVKDFGAGASDADNGIYEITQLADGVSSPAILTRATDFDEDSEVNQGDSVFVSEGTVNAKRTFALVTPDPITVDTTAQEWSIVSGPGFITAGAGLLDTGNTFSVELDTTAASTGAGSGGGSSGLEFDAAGDNGKLRAAVSATGALRRQSDGLGVGLEASNPSLQIAANELGVKLDPARAITKDASGVGVNLEASNPSLAIVANELGVKFAASASALSKDATGLKVNVDGSTVQINGSNQLSVITANLPADRVENDIAVNEAIAVSDAVNWSPTNDRIEKSRADSDAKSDVMGVATTAQAVVGNNATIVSHGTAASVLTAATAGQAFYLQATGGIGTAIPTGNVRVVQVGNAENATDLWVRIVDFGKRRT